MADVVVQADARRARVALDEALAVLLHDEAIAVSVVRRSRTTTSRDRSCEAFESHRAGNGSAIAISAGMSRSSLVASVCLLVTGCVVVTPIAPYGSKEMMEPEPEEDNTAAIIGGVAVGVVVTGLVAILVTRARANKEFESPVPADDPIAITPSLRDMFARGLVAAQRNDCAMALAIDGQLALEAPSFHARYAIEPPIVACREQR
jgi:hypothetical protein